MNFYFGKGSNGAKLEELNRKCPFKYTLKDFDKRLANYLSKNSDKDYAQESAIIHNRANDDGCIAQAYYDVRYNLISWLDLVQRVYHRKSCYQTWHKVVNYHAMNHFNKTDWKNLVLVSKMISLPNPNDNPHIDLESFNHMIFNYCCRNLYEISSNTNKDKALTMIAHLSKLGEKMHDHLFALAE